MLYRRGTIISAALFLSAVLLCLSGCETYASRPEGETPPKNIIILIGDGMGAGHVTAAKTVSGTINMERFVIAGLVTTHPHGEYVTDSAAGGTAMATGFKTYNGAISVDPEGEVLKTVLEYAEEKEMSTGLVATSSITHATPAVFASHVDDRGKYGEIAEQMTGSGADVLFGGGLAWFIPSSEEGSRRTDGTDLTAELETRMTVARSVEEFRLLSTDGPAAAFIALEHPGGFAERGVALSELTEKAIGILSSDPDGFFLMVEGSQIDWSAHDRDCPGIIGEMLDFDGAVGTALDFASDGETLVIVTADHETGGFAVHNGSVEGNTVTGCAFTTGSHTGNMVPIFAYGPGAGALGGIHDNTEIGRIMIEYVSR